jgi:glycine/D-amino acid oxidase-like deaminating enzyme
MADLPAEEISCWKSDYTESVYPELADKIEVDAVIIGGGITGLTTAYLLKRSGLKVAVLEKRTVGAGTTGRTTGKVTSQHNLIYAELNKLHGPEVTAAYGLANQTAVDQVERIIKKEAINCGWQREDNYVYTNEANQIQKFKHEAKVAASLGLPASFEISTPLPFETKAAVKFSNQAKIHSVQYLKGLAKATAGNGSFVFENSEVTRINDGDPCTVSTKRAEVTAKHVVVATNVPTFPLVARGGYCLLEYPTESYIVAGKPTKGLQGMYISPDSGHYSILPVEVDGDKLILVGGESNISGVRISKEKKFQKLADYAKNHFGVTDISYKWSDRDYMSYDNIPLVGKLYPWSKNLYVGTAFMKWGLSNGTVAAMILRDLICKEPNEWSRAFDSNRLKPIASIPRVAAKYLIPGVS